MSTRSTIRSGTLMLAIWALGVLSLAYTLFDAWSSHPRQANAVQQQQMLTGRLGLTDPALFTEARYGRHLALADLHAPFQDHPMAFDYFPTGSLVAPPPHFLPQVRP